MKVGTTDLIKFRHLKRALKLSHFATVGLLESLWLFALKTHRWVTSAPECTELPNHT